MDSWSNQVRLLVGVSSSRGTLVGWDGGRYTTTQVTTTMQRRKFLIGAGSIAAAGTGVLGSGAFSAMSAERDANIDVVADDNALLALKPGTGADERVYLTDNPGELKIDFTSDEGGQGVNVNSIYQVGGWNTAGGMSYTDVDQSDVLDGYSQGGQPPAFLILNEDDQTHNVSAEYTVTDPSAIGNASLHFQFIPQGGQSNANKQGIDIDNNSSSDSFGPEPTPSGHQWAVSILVDTRDVTQNPSNLDLSGTLTVSAESQQQS